MVEGLGTDLADVVHAHQRRRVSARIDLEVMLGYANRRRRPRRVHHPGDRPQSPIELADQPLDWKHAERLAEKKRAPKGARR
jgi:hypothetical protein